MTVGYCTIQLAFSGRHISLPAGAGQSPGGVQGAKPLEAAKNQHLTVPKIGSKIDQKYMNAFFPVRAVQNHRKVPKKVQNFKFSSFFIRKMCMFHFSGWTIFYKIKKQAKTTDQCQDRPFTLQHLCTFSRHALFFSISLPHRHLGLCFNLSHHS